MTILPRALVVVLTTLTIASCTGDGAQGSSTTSPMATSTSGPEPTTSATSTVTTTTPTTTTSVAPSTTLDLPPFPPERTSLTHGGDAWVVVLAASEDIDGTELAAAEAAAAAAGYRTGATDCDFGAATALGLDEESGHYYTVSVYLNSEEDARTALAAFQARQIEGAVGLVQTYCLD